MSLTLDAPHPVREDPTTPRRVRTFRPDIEGLRAVAVLLVVLSHLGLGFPGGYVGVDVFFVISGFLITKQLMNDFTTSGRIRPLAFYSRRVRRILPAASVVIAGTLLASRAFDSPLRVSTDALDGLCSSLSAVNWRLAHRATDYFQSGTATSPFQHYWSLSVEEQFYIVWPMLLLIIGLIARHRRGRLKSIVWTLTLIIVVSLSLSIATTTNSPSWAYFGTHTRAWELALGALLGATVPVWTRMPPALASQMSWLGLGAILLAALAYSDTTAYPGAAVLLPVLGSAFVIAGGCPGWPRGAEWALKRSPMQFVGRVSYSWYLVHWPVIVLLPLALDHPLTLAQRWLVLGGSLVGATLLFFTVEQPIRTRPLFVRRPLIGIAIGALLLGSTGTTTWLLGQATMPGGSSLTAATPGAPAPAPSTVNTVETAVTAAAALTRLPAGLTPTLTAAATDRPDSGPCLVSRPETAPPPDSACTFGDPTANRTMALVGDSHANQWFSALSAFAQAQHWKLVFYGKAACPIGNYRTYVDATTNRLYTQCNDWRSALLGRIRALRPAVVVIANELRTVDVDPTGMVQTVTALSANGAKVVYVEDSPNPGNAGAIPDCLASHPQNIQKCSLHRGASNTRLEGMVARSLEANAVRKVGATVIDPTQWFCTATVCPPVINNMIVYADSSHITATYATWLTPVVATALEAAAGS
jgi:peptidoglycan/LPS O-acetylase OafA/YrhL